MNTELLLKIADAIEADMEAFNMRSWGSLIDGRVELEERQHPFAGDETYLAPANGPDDREMPSEAECKTAFCVGGEALFLSGYEPVYSMHWEDDTVSTVDGRIERRWVRSLSSWTRPDGDEGLYVDCTEEEATELLGWVSQPEVRTSGSSYTKLFHDVEVKPQVMIDVLRALANRTFHPRIRTWPNGEFAEDELGEAWDRDAFNAYNPKDDEVERVAWREAAIIVKAE